jgi:hypothetical protein
LSSSTLVVGRWTLSGLPPNCDHQVNAALFANYAIENVSFVAGETNGPTYLIVGHGTYRVGGEVAVQQDLSL